MPAGFGAIYVLPSHPVTSARRPRAPRSGHRLRYDIGHATSPSAVSLARHSAVAVIVSPRRRGRTPRPDHAGPAAATRTRSSSAVAAANPRTIVVLETGSAVLMPWLELGDGRARDVVPGAGGRARRSLDLLSGQVDPSGKLPVTFPASPTLRPDVTAATFGGVGGQGALLRRHRRRLPLVRRPTRSTPAFSFGFGLSYTNFGFSDLSAATTAERRDRGRRPRSPTPARSRGADVVQCYVGRPAVGPASRPGSCAASSGWISLPGRRRSCTST